MAEHNQVPPLTAADIERRLEDDTLSVYLYVGAEADPGWENATFACGLLPALRVYLIGDFAEILKIQKIADFVGSQRPRGIVFGFGPKPMQRLNKSETEDLRTVLDAILKARS